MRLLLPLLILSLAPAGPLAAAQSAPAALPIADTIPAARDVPWPGTLTLSVDATDITHGILEVAETIPVAGAGPLTLLYPEWIPGDHSPAGTIEELAGLRITSGGHPVAWVRDAIDVFAFHVDVPAGAASLRVEFQFLAPTSGDQGQVVTTPELLNLEWNSVAFYPAGYYVRQIQIEASLRLPFGWTPASALEVAGRDGARVRYRTTSFDTLMDSPVFAGVHERTVDLAPGVRLNLFADRPEQLAATDDEIQPYRNLVMQAVRVFGAQHYDHYDFLFALSDSLGDVGLEHHRSSENDENGWYFTDWKDSLSGRDQLPHEYTHSWNGKFRRPAGLWTPDYRTPMQDSLLWVYEGQTQFWGFVLAARAGLLSPDDVRAEFAYVAAKYEARSGRTWRPLIDTTNDPVITQRQPQGWVSWQRAEDYYDEGQLIWLDVDSLLRQLSGGRRSIDDFARAFFGVNDRDWGELTYTFEDIVSTLNSVQPYAWGRFLKDRLENTSEHAPLDGITRGGYRLAYSETPTDWFSSNEKSDSITDLTYSGGFVLGKDAQVTSVNWHGPAFDAGLTVGTKIIAVNGRAFDTDDLRNTIRARKSPLALLVRNGDIFRTVSLTYDGGLRYPTLVRSGTGHSSLDDLLVPRP